jgi:hypothetical protein
MKAHIINFNPLLLPTPDLIGFLDSQYYHILNWCMPFVGTVLIVSNYDRNVLSNLIANHFNSTQFLMTEANIFNTQGMMPSQIWDFINNPKSSGRLEKHIAESLKAMNYNNPQNQGSLGF